jgi:GNAT superfamily N-acetyltransferase
MTQTWGIRPARADDVDAVIEVADLAWRDTYGGLLKPETIQGFIERAYSPQRVSARVAEDHFYVAEGENGIVAFVDAIERPDRVDLVAIYAMPEIRGRGAGTALLTTIVGLFPRRDISADVLIGNKKGEIFYERRGFNPRETFETTLLGEAVVERRWWRDA